MKVWILKVLNDISNNYQGIDDIEVYVYENRARAITSFINRNLNAISFLTEISKCSAEDLDIEESKNFFHVNDGNNYITCKLEEKEIL